MMKQPVARSVVAQPVRIIQAGGIFLVSLVWPIRKMVKRAWPVMAREMMPAMARVRYLAEVR